MADLESASSNAFFEVLEEWNAVLEAERYLLEQALEADDQPDDPPPPTAPASPIKKRGMGQ